MKRTLLLMAMVVALVLGTMTMALADRDPEITSPTAGQVVYENTLYLEADAGTDTSTQLNYAVRQSSGNGQCDWGAQYEIIEREVGVWTDEDGIFTKTLSIPPNTQAGEYCFAFDPTAPNKARVVQEFYIVDEYAKVGGNLNHGESDNVRGNAMTHALDGLVGDAGDAGIVGEVSINYRQLGETCTFSPGGLALRDAPAVVEGDNVRADLGGGSTLGGENWANSCGGNAHIILLDRDAGAEADDDGESYPRGAIVVDASEGAYSIEDSPAPRWVGLERGNVHVGIR